jgi:hypothetical protein
MKKPTTKAPIACASWDNALQSLATVRKVGSRITVWKRTYEVHSEGKYGPVGPMSPKYMKNEGIAREAPLAMLSYPNIMAEVNATAPERSQYGCFSIEQGRKDLTAEKRSPVQLDGFYHAQMTFLLFEKSPKVGSFMFVCGIEGDRLLVEEIGLHLLLR